MSSAWKLRPRPGLQNFEFDSGLTRTDLGRSAALGFGVLDYRCLYGGGSWHEPLSVSPSAGDTAARYLFDRDQAIYRLHRSAGCPRRSTRNGVHGALQAR